MAKQPKKAERKIKDLPVETKTGEKVKGGSVSINPIVPSRKTITRDANKLFRPKS